MPDVLWSGHVRVIEEGGKRCIEYQADEAPAPAVYVPSGFFENKAVNGLVDKLKG